MRCACLLAALLLIAGCAEIPQSAMAKVCVSDKQGVGARVPVIEFGRQGTITEILGPSRECRNPEFPVLAVVKG